MASNATNGEPSKKETRVSFRQGSAVETDQVEISMPNSKKKKKRRHRYLPKPFERSNGSFLNPKFDSDILESYLVKCYFPQTRRMFNKTIIYIGICSFCWALYFGLIHLKYTQQHWQFFMIGSIAMLLVMIAFILFARSSYFEKHSKAASILLAMILVVTIQLPFVFEDPDISSIATFCGVVEILLLLYSFFPINIIAAAGFGVLLSVSYEILTALRYDEMEDADFIFGKVLLHVILHVIGIYIFIISNTRARSNFSKIGQSVLAQKDLKYEREMKEKMIHSLMPPAVAKSVMATHPSKEDEEEAESSKKRRKRQDRGEIIFRKFQMDEMHNVSILFADIVGFTKMSSNKTAERLVGLLNDLFGRFDKLCNASSCEKISTLGDCYYCVSGCPDLRPDHAKCCVEMGLSMVIAIQAFDEDHSEEVNMRVGIHTGTVLCGIVGTRRFKFDVWSNDVTLANTMESSGEPGKVHISESTREFLKDEYDMVEGEEVADMRGRKELIEHYDPEQSSFTIKHREEIRNIKTYFITGRKDGNSGIPGLEKLALERPAEIKLMERYKTAGKPGQEGQEESVAGGPKSNEVENGSSANPDLFSQRIPTDTIGEEGGDNHEKTADDTDGAGADSNLLGGRANSKDNDKELIRLIDTETESHKAFFTPNLTKFWLTFKPNMEREYRYYFMDSYLFQENMLSSPRYQMVFEAGIALLELIILAVSFHIVFDSARTGALTAITIVGLLLQLLVFIDALTNIICLKAKSKKFPGLMRLTLNWYFRNIQGVVMATIPTVLVYVTMSCDMITSHTWTDRFFVFGLVVALLQYCNYTMLRSMMKTLVAIIVGSILIVLLFIQLCSFPGLTSISTTSSTSTPIASYKPFFNTTNSTANSTTNSTDNDPNMRLQGFDSTNAKAIGFSEDHLFSGDNLLRFETIISMLLLLLLIGIVNYEFEMSYRLSFNASEKAQKDKENMQLNKDQADWLLHNIIPAHLTDLFKTSKSYSRNHPDVGVIFATIVNFNEFYDEMYAGGREYLRVLNELVSDYEVMLGEHRFKDVEKIKTISATFMAAAGLNEESRGQNKHPYAHLFALMEFAMELQNVIDRFNDSIFNFNFILNIGYNYGPVTAGVIGTTKLMYDIWGDTVNIASRMYSTGEPDRIQVPQGTAEALDEMFEFSYRDDIFVKGKGMMKTYLVEGKRSGASWS